MPLQKGFRAIPIGDSDLIPVIAGSHKHAKLALDAQALAEVLPKLSRIITHDMSQLEVARSEGLGGAGQSFYVQNMDQKIEAILAGIGIGHLPRKRIQQHLDRGELKELKLANVSNHEYFMAWKISNKGKGLQALTQLLMSAKWS